MVICNTGVRGPGLVFSETDGRDPDPYLHKLAVYQMLGVEGAPGLRQSWEASRRQWVLIGP